MCQVLFVDDDPNILHINRAYFEPRGFEVFTAETGAEALKLAAEHDLDCIVLDVILPTGEDGYRLCRELRERWSTPILFLTSLTEQDFLYQGFASGGDDFMTKPYDLRELLLRVEARIRQYRGKQQQTRGLSYPPLYVDLVSRQATLKGEKLALTGGEFDILSLLCSNPNRVYSADEIYSEVWKMPGMAGTHTVQVHMSHLRRKLESVDPDHKFIQTAWGKGYLFVPSSGEDLKM